MPGSRDHEPVVIEQFNGFWHRGDDESCPLDHFLLAENIKYFQSGFENRDPIDKYQTAGTLLKDIRRIYNYVTQNGQTLLVLNMTGTVGNIYHLVGQTVVHGPILSIDGMTDFGFVAIAGRAYITPFNSFVDANGRTQELGLLNQFVRVYNGSATPLPATARKAGGMFPIGTALVAGTGAPYMVGGINVEATDIGTHILAIVYETDTGFLTALGPRANFTSPPAFGVHLNYPGKNLITLSNIPDARGFPEVKKRHIVSTKAIPNYNGDQTGYQFFFIPEGALDNNDVFSTGSLRYFDSDLLGDASHLMDNFVEIPAGVNLNTYHSRMIIVGERGLDGPPNTTEDTLEGLPSGVTDNRSLARVSYPGEPEAISKIDGLIIAPLDGNPLTNCQEFRDVLYLFKKTRTFAYSDNRDEPATWQEEVVDQGVGASVHGIATVLDSGGVNVDFLLIVDWSGLMIFNGVYARPELSWKIEDYWSTLTRNAFGSMQIVNDSLEKQIYITLPPPFQNFVLHADYGDGLDAKNINWARWVFNAKMSSACLIQSNMLIFGATVG